MWFSFSSTGLKDTLVKWIVGHSMAYYRTAWNSWQKPDNMLYFLRIHALTTLIQVIIFFTLICREIKLHSHWWSEHIKGILYKQRLVKPASVGVGSVIIPTQNSGIKPQYTLWHRQEVIGYWFDTVFDHTDSHNTISYTWLNLTFQQFCNDQFKMLYLCSFLVAEGDVSFS